jgi:hypothetical protein
VWGSHQPSVDDDDDAGDDDAVVSLLQHNQHQDNMPR